MSTRDEGALYRAVQKGRTMQKITPFLWFDANAEEAVNFYLSIFKNSKILKVARYGDTGPGPAGTVMTISFQLEGQEFIALNGGPHFKFTEAISLSVSCETQEELDDYWSKLTAAGGQEVQCGWLKDKFGLSWQVNPPILAELLTDKDAKKAQRVMTAMMQMKKIDIAGLQRAAAQQ
jgi:predicted 3-demethylubiquinone-9 3-methyltransferase (glyoxalase superfamily)